MKSTRDFIAVQALARLGNFGRAADELGVTQSALTRHLQKIETDLGVGLFTRSSRGVEPTRFGLIVLERGEHILNAFADLAREIELARSPETGELRIVATMFPAAISVRAAIEELALRHPRLQIHFLIEDQPKALEMVRDREADIGVFWLPERPDDDLAYRRLPRRPHVFYCRPRHPLALFRDASIAQIANYPMVGFRMGRAMAPFESGDPGAAGRIDPKTGEFIPKILVNSFEAAYSVVKAGNSISWAPLCLLKDRAEKDRIATLAFSTPAFLCGYEIVWPAARPLSSAAEAFVALLTEIEAGRD